MAISKTYIPSEFTYDTNKIEEVLSKLQLKLVDNPGQDFTENFDSVAGHTYDANSEIVDGRWKQKDKRISGAKFAANYNIDINGNWGDGILTGTSGNGASAISGKLDLSGSINKYIDYDANLNADMQQEGGIVFDWYPQYSGAGSFQYLISICESIGVANNRIRIYHQSTLLFISIADQAGGTIVSSAESLSPIADTKYEIALIWDITNGDTKLYINRVQLGSTHTETGIRSSSIGLVRLGKDLNLNGNADFKIDNLIFFSTKSAAENYINGSEIISDYIYLESYDTLPEMEYTGAGTLVLLTALTYLKQGDIKIALQKDRSGMWDYWDGAQWATGDGTKDYMSTIEDFVANISTLVVLGSTIGQFKLYLPDSNTQGYIDYLTASLTAQIYPIDPPSILFLDSITHEGLEEFLDEVEKVTGDFIEYILSKDGIEMYYDGSAWVESDGEYPQCNTSEEIRANKDSFTSSGLDMGIKAFLVSNDGITTPVLNSLSVGYNYWGGDIPAPSTRLLKGIVKDEEGNPIEGAIISFRLSESKVVYNNQTLLFPTGQVTDEVTDEDGYWEKELIETENMSNETRWLITYEYSNIKVGYKINIPYATDESEIDISTLIE